MPKSNLIQKKSYETKKKRNYGRDAPIAPTNDADPKKDVLGATGDQGYMNKLFGSLSKEDQDLSAPQIDEKELELLDDAGEVLRLSKVVILDRNCSRMQIYPLSCHSHSLVVSSR